MPLPRFDRLAPAARAAILATARSHFARDGKDGASFNQIIADAGISKTTAYHYFDGKDDVFAAVVTDAAARTLAVLGPWSDASTAADLWRQVAAGSERLAGHLREHPDDRAVLAAAPHLHDDNPWIEHLIANGLRLGVVDPEPDLRLITMATVAVVGAVDGWALTRAQDPDDPVGPALIALLQRLWNTPRVRGAARSGGRTRRRGAAGD